MFIPDPNFFHPGSEFFHPGSRIRIQELKYFNPKKMVSKLSEILSRLFIPDPDFLPIPDPGGQKGTGSRIQIRNTAIQSLLERKSARTVVRHTLVSSAVREPLVALRYTFLISSMFRNREMNATK
jgi:hypothetical protein